MEWGYRNEHSKVNQHLRLAADKAMCQDKALGLRMEWGASKCWHWQGCCRDGGEVRARQAQA